MSRHLARFHGRLDCDTPRVGFRFGEVIVNLLYQTLDGWQIAFARRSKADDLVAVLLDLEVQEAARRAGQVARGLAGTLRIGFVESICWHGIVPESFRRFRQERQTLN